MKVVVTGGSGRLGQHLIRDLLEHGYDVLSLDRVAPQTKLCASWIADLRSSGDLYEALRGADGVAHLGAYQAPNLASDSETFSNNVSATYNVLKASAGNGVKRVVLASSVAVYGFLYAARIWPPEYLPLDENHPCRPQDPYGLSKLVGEQIADSFASSSDIAVASLRLPGINFDLSYRSFPERWKNPEAKLGGFWSYIDARDAATAFRLALQARLNGHRIFNVGAPTSTMKEPTRELIRRYFPEVKKIKEGFEENWSGMDSSKAGRELEFKTRHAWEKYVGG